MEKFAVSVWNKVKNNLYLFAVVTKGIGVLLATLDYAMRARVFGKYYNGIYSYTYSILSTAVVFSAFSIYDAYTYYRKEEGEGYKKKYYGASQLLLMIYIIAGIVFSIVYHRFDSIMIVMLSIPAFTYSKCLMGTMRIEYPGLRNVIETIVYLVDVLLFAVLYYFFEVNIYWVATIIIIKDLVKCLLYTIFLRPSFALQKTSFKELKRLFAFGSIPMLCLLMSTLNHRVDVIMLKQFLPFDQVGIYSVGSSLAEQCWIIPEAIRDILLSKLVLGKKEGEVAKVCRFSFSVVFVIAIFILFFGKIIILILFGEAYIPSYYTAVVEMFGVLGMVYVKMVVAYNVVEGRRLINLMFLAIGVIANVGVNLLLIPKYGIDGAAFATLVSYTLCGILFAGYFTKKTGISMKDMLFIRRDDLSMLKNIEWKKKK